MKNTSKTTRRANNKIIASVCAVIAATAMVTGIAVFSASASEIENAPVKTTVSTVAAASTQTKAEVKTEAEQTVKAENKTEEKTNEKHSETASEEVAQPRMLGFNFEAVKRNYELYEQEQAAKQAETKKAETKKAEPKQAEPKQDVQQACAEKQPGEAGYNYVNENGKHPGESGYGYNEKKNGTLFPSGLYYDANGTRATLEIATYDGVTCYCTVTLPNGIARQVVYGFMGVANGSKMEYTRGSKNDQQIGEDGGMIETTVVDKNHYGTIKRTNTGLVWQDNDGNEYVFIDQEV